MFTLNSMVQLDGNSFLTKISYSIPHNSNSYKQLSSRSYNSRRLSRRFLIQKTSSNSKFRITGTFFSGPQLFELCRVYCIFIPNRANALVVSWGSPLIQSWLDCWCWEWKFYGDTISNMRWRNNLLCGGLAYNAAKQLTLLVSIGYFWQLEANVLHTNIGCLNACNVLYIWKNSVEHISTIPSNKVLGALSIPNPIS